MFQLMTDKLYKLCENKESWL